MNILVFIIVLAVLIFVHELGHFLTAKWAKLKVEEFGFGFPPRMLGKKVGETIYSINWIPFGGFVKIFGEDGEGGEDERSFAAQPARIRFIILFAGAAMNFLLGWLLLSTVLGLGTRVSIDDTNRGMAKEIAVTITAVAPDSPAFESGLQPGDTVYEVLAPDVVEDQVIIHDVAALSDFIDFVQDHAGKTLEIEFERGGEIMTRSVLARADPPEGEGSLGIGVTETGFVQYAPLAALKQGARASYNMSGAVLRAFGGMVRDLFTGAGVSSGIVGPVGLVNVTSMAYQAGIVNLLQLVAVISLNLAVLNLLPIPALDGGRILFVAIEKLRGGPISREAEKWVHGIGFLLLILLLVIVTIKDVAQLF